VLSLRSTKISKSESDIEKAIKKEMSGDLEAGMLAIGNLISNKGRGYPARPTF
jgi:hypothetical protein